MKRRDDKEQLKDMPTFLQRVSVLVKEGYSFPESINMLLPHHIENASIVHQQLQERFRNGEGVIGIMTTLGIPNHHLVSISIAEHNGHLHEALSGIAKQMDFSQKMHQRLKKIMLYPVALLSFLVMLFVVFRTYFFPNIERMIASRGGSADESVWLSGVLLKLPDFSVLALVICGMGILGFRRLLTNQHIAKQLHIQLMIPIWRSYFRLHLTRIFAKHLGNLLMSGFSLQASLQVLQQQTYQPMLQHLALQLKEQVILGESLSRSVNVLRCFQKDFVTFVEHGEQSGYLGKELMLYSDLLDERFEEKIQQILAIIQPAFFAIIAICVIIAYLSLLLPIYSMIDFV